ncbi:MAG: 2Fe-2S iron-sulfur cluster-binding protein [Betaproteobacteria bacterium]
MLARRPDDARLAVAFTFDGADVVARQGDSVAAALIASGRLACRVTPVEARPRGPWCLMGACQDCLVEVDGVPNAQGCMLAVVPGMRVATQRGARAIDASVPSAGFAIRDSTIQALEAADARDGDATVLDVAVIGAGPAGLAAATLAAESGLAVALFDEQAGVGGQVHRAITASPLARPEALGADYWAGGIGVRAFERSGSRHRAGASVWALWREADGTMALAVSTGAPLAPVSSVVRARAVIAAIGAIERPMPLPGWTLPGAMSVGGAQILLKASGIVATRGTVIAGSGPLVWLYAWQCLEAGGTIDAILDTTPRGRLAQAIRHAGAFALSRYAARGWELVRAVRARVRIVEHVESIVALGADRVTGVRFARDGAFDTLACDTLLLHQGVVPHLNLPLAAGCDVAWNERQRCFEPIVDDWGGSSVPGLWITGDGAGVAGADAAPHRGALSALSVANALGRFDADARDRKARPHRKALARALRGRAFLDAVYAPAEAFVRPGDETIACRCEEVTAGRIVAAARSGALGPNQAKTLTRCGMGPCQGRLCGPTVNALVAHACGLPFAEAGTFRQRFPVGPVTLGEVASLPASPAAIDAVVRVPDPERSSR